MTRQEEARIAALYAAVQLARARAENTSYAAFLNTVQVLRDADEFERFIRRPNITNTGDMGGA